MMVVLMKILQVILALSILIVIHEFGHFTFAKLFGIRVDKFFLFFDAGGTKLFSTKGKWFTRIFPKAKDWETEYGIGWLPLGGYCKICGMIDESMDLESIKKDPQPWEFRTKKAWQRLLVMGGGVLYNFIFAIIAYIGIMAIWGSAYISNEGSQIYTNELGVELGFRNGDHIIRMDEYVPENFGMLQADLARRNVSKVTVLRDNDTVDLYIDRSKIGAVLNTPGVFDLAVPFVIDSVMSASANSAAGLLHDDRIIAITASALLLCRIPENTFRKSKAGPSRPRSYVVQTRFPYRFRWTRLAGWGLYADSGGDDEGIFIGQRHPSGSQADFRHHRGISSGSEAGGFAKH